MWMCSQKCGAARIASDAGFGAGGRRRTGPGASALEFGQCHLAAVDEIKDCRNLHRASLPALVAVEAVCTDPAETGRGSMRRRTTFPRPQARQALVKAAAAIGLAAGALGLTLHRGGLLALAHLGWLFVELAPAHLGQYAGLLASALETPQGRVKDFVLFYPHVRQVGIPQLQESRILATGAPYCNCRRLFDGPAADGTIGGC